MACPMCEDPFGFDLQIGLERYLCDDAIYLLQSIFFEATSAKLKGENYDVLAEYEDTIKSLVSRHSGLRRNSKDTK